MWARRLNCSTAAIAATKPRAHSAAGEYEGAQEGRPLHGSLGGRTREAERASRAAARQFMMFSANHLRHSAVFSARSLWSMMMACFFHCSGGA